MCTKNYCFLHLHKSTAKDEISHNPHNNTICSPRTEYCSISVHHSWSKHCTFYNNYSKQMIAQYVATTKPLYIYFVKELVILHFRLVYVKYEFLVLFLVVTTSTRQK